MMRPTRTLIAVLAAGALFAPMLATAPAAADPATRYVALGDSYASGEGQAPYQDGTATATNTCHRSKQHSYPALLNGVGLTGYTNLTSVACSGAITASLVAPLPGAPEPPQLAAVTPDTTRVTLTIGGNDIGFATVLTGCAYPASAKARQYATGGVGCRTTFEPLVAPRIAALSGRQGAPTIAGVVPIPQLLGAIQTQAPGATIIVTGYPKLFGTTMTDKFGCKVSSQLPIYISRADVRWIRQKVAGLNTAIQDGVRLARKSGVKVRYVHPATAFKDRNLCDKSKTPWINPLIIDPTAPTQVSPASFHPTEIGQIAYAVTVAWPGLTSARQAQARVAAIAGAGR